jgi:hypothetical protein
MAISPSLIDKRVVARSIRKGLLDQKEFRRLLDELPDRSDNIAESEPIPVPETRTTSSAIAPQVRAATPEATTAVGDPVPEPVEERQARDEPRGDGDDAGEQPQTRQLPPPEPVGDPPQDEKLQARAAGDEPPGYPQGGGER